MLNINHLLIIIFVAIFFFILFISYNSLQYQKRSKTQWHKPLTNTIFSSHFKESSRNTEFHIEQLVAKGAFGVVFKVRVNRDKQQQKNYSIGKQQLHVVNDNESRQSAATEVYALKVLKKSKVKLFVCHICF